MATVDRTSGDWYLTALGGNIYIDALGGRGSVSIFGNLLVVGNQTNIGSVETLISDNFITLAANVTSGTPVLNAGIQVSRGDSPKAAIQWTEQLNKWQMTYDSVLYRDIMSRVADDPTPTLGGHLNLAGYEIRSSPGENIVLVPGNAPTGSNAGVQISHSVTNVLPAVNDATVVYSKAPGAGAAGLYVSNSSVLNAELITKRKALIFSLVL